MIGTIITCLMPIQSKRNRRTNLWILRSWQDMRDIPYRKPNPTKKQTYLTVLSAPLKLLYNFPTSVLQQGTTIWLFEGLIFLKLNFKLLNKLYYRVISKFISKSSLWNFIIDFWVYSKKATKKINLYKK